MNGLEFILDAFLPKLNELNYIVLRESMSILCEININQSRKHFERDLNSICHAGRKVFSEHSRESGIHFGGVGMCTIEFKDTATEI